MKTGKTAGRCRCLRCGHEFSAYDCIYQAVHVTGSGMVRYDIIPGYSGKPRVRRGEKELDPKSVKVVNISPSRGVPISITLDITESGHTFTLETDNTNRCCPYCQTGVHPLEGYHTTLIVACIGPRSIGKSTFCNCLISRTGLHRLNDMLYSLGYTASADTVEDVQILSATPVETQLLQGFTIRSHSLQLTILFFDVAGELFESNLPAETASLGTKYKNRLGLCDAFLLFHDPRDLCGASINPSAGGKTLVINDIISRYSEKPTIHLFTKGDVLQAQIRRTGPLAGRDFNNTHANALTVSSPVFHRVDPPNSQEQMDEKLALHIALANRFFHRCVRSYVPVGDRDPCFLVSSGSSRNTDKGSAINHEDEYNTALPVAYLLRQYL